LIFARLLEVRCLLFLATAAFSLQAWAQNPPGQTQPAPEHASRLAPAAAGGTAPQIVEDPAQAQRLFRELDKNHDGYLSGEELRGAPNAVNWAAIDRNGDRRITPDEFTVLRR
jgi:hypothetical protein